MPVVGTRPRSPAQKRLDMRALEVAAGTDARLNHHEIECRDRYLALDKKLDAISGILLRAGSAAMALLIAAVGMLLKTVLHL